MNRTSVVAALVCLPLLAGCATPYSEAPYTLVMSDRTGLALLGGCATPYSEAPYTLVMSDRPGLALLAGCATPYSEAPLATNFSTTKQPKLQAASHWNLIAVDVAEQISESLKEKRPLYVTLSSVKTAFDRAFANQLISALLAEGHTVLKAPAGALSVEVDTQAVRFSANRPQYNHVGLATALTTGVWALYQADATAGAVVFAGGVASADAYSWFRSEFATGETPQTEIIVTASVSDASQYLARSTSVYYVADSDQALYQATPQTTRTITTPTIGVTGGP